MDLRNAFWFKGCSIDYEINIDNCIEIASDFTLGFIEWCKKEENNIYFDTQQLLEIYKKTL